MKDKVTVIVPIYNVEKYLENCLLSIINQTYKNLEILLINDGSTDGSLDICKKYEKKDSRVKVISKPNGGVSSARNLGIEKATGEWIADVDGDDEILPNRIEILLNAAQENNVELVRDCKILVKNGEETYSQLPNRNGDKFQQIHGVYGLAGIFFKRSFVVEHKIRFNEQMKNGEDYLFLIELIAYDIKFIFIDKHLYKYVLHEDSAFHKVSDLTENHMIFIKELEKIKSLRQCYTKELDVIINQRKEVKRRNKLFFCFASKKWFSFLYYSIIYFPSLLSLVKERIKRIIKNR